MRCGRCVNFVGSFSINLRLWHLPILDSFDCFLCGPVTETLIELSVSHCKVLPAAVCSKLVPLKALRLSTFCNNADELKPADVQLLQTALPRLSVMLKA